MQFTNSINQELLDILNPYAEWFFEQDDHDALLPTGESLVKRMGGMDHISSCSIEYMNHVVGKDGAHIGFPEVAYCCDISQGVGVIPKHHVEKQQELNSQLIAYLGARNVAVHTYYPPNGFMGWHNNWNAHGYNILLTYNSEENGGFFRYLDPITKEVVTLIDPKGWSCKVGYFGRGREPDKVVYHCCSNTAKRLTLGYVVPHLEIWRSMIEDISGEDASHFS